MNGGGDKDSPIVKDLDDGYSLGASHTSGAVDKNPGNAAYIPGGGAVSGETSMGAEVSMRNLDASGGVRETSVDGGTEYDVKDDEHSTEGHTTVPIEADVKVLRTDATKHATKQGPNFSDEAYNISLSLERAEKDRTLNSSRGRANKEKGEEVVYHFDKEGARQPGEGARQPGEEEGARQPGEGTTGLNFHGAEATGKKEDPVDVRKFVSRGKVIRPNPRGLGIAKGSRISNVLAAITNTIRAFTYNTFGYIKRTTDKYSFVEISDFENDGKGQVLKLGGIDCIAPLSEHIAHWKIRDGIGSRDETYALVLNLPGDSGRTTLQLKRVRNNAGSEIRDAEGRYLYKIVDYEAKFFPERSYKEHNYVVWVDSTGAVALPDGKISQRYEGRISTNYLRIYEPQSKELQFLPTVLHFPFAVSALVVRWSFSIAGSITSIVGRASCALADKVVEGSGSELLLHRSGVLQVSKPREVLLYFRSVIGGIIGVVGSGAKFVGDITSGLGHCSASLISAMGMIVPSAGYKHRLDLSLNYVSSTFKGLGEGVLSDFNKFVGYLGFPSAEVSGSKRDDGAIAVSDKTMDVKSGKGKPPIFADIKKHGDVLSESKVEYVGNEKTRGVADYVSHCVSCSKIQALTNKEALGR